MTNILKVSSFVNQNNSPIIKNKIPTKNNRQMFFRVFNSERKSLLFNKQNKAKNTAKNSVHSSYKTQNVSEKYTDQTNCLSDINKFHCKSRSNTVGNKTLQTKTEKFKENKNTDIDRTTGDIEEAGENLIASFQSVLLAILENISGLKNMDIDSESIETYTEQLQSLENLEEQLFLLSEIIDTLADNSLKQNIETIIVRLINKTSEQQRLMEGKKQVSNNKIQLTAYELSKMLNSLEELKVSTQSIFNRSNINKSVNSQVLHTKDEPLNPEEQLTKVKKGEILLDVNDIKKEIQNNIKTVDKFISNDKEEHFSKQPKKGIDVLFKEQIIMPQQKISEQVIGLRIAESQATVKSFISEIAQKVSEFILKNKNEMTIRLTPENLGKLSIKVGLNEGTLTGKIYAENYSVKETIESNLSQLRDCLEEQGFNIASLEVHIDNSQDFERNLYELNFANKQKSKTNPIKISNGVAVVEQNIDETNPYLKISQFDSLV